jgi:putative hemolysin
MTAALRADASDHGHIVDALIEERAPKLSASPCWPLLRPFLYKLLDYRRAREVADALAPLSGAQALEYASAMLRLKIETRGFERVPRQGRLVVIINHPTGLADGVAVYDALKAIRPDLTFFANADALRVCPRLTEVLIPVEWVEAKRTREKTRATLEAARAALEAERPLVISPAGRIARHQEDGFWIDPPWQPSAASIARKYRAPILPLFMHGPPSPLFRLGARLSPELRDVTLFHELLNKKGGLFRLTAGPPIPPQRIDDPAAFTERLKRYVERELPVDPDRPFA